MRKKLQNIVSLLFIILLLPYIITTLCKGGINFAKEKKVEHKKTILVNDNHVQFKLDIEQYVVGLVAAEIPINYNREAIKAQCVIARTNVVKKIGSRDTLNTSDLNLDYMNMVEMEQYWGYDKFFDHYNLLREMVMETKGEIIEYENQPIEAAFHEVSIGKTRSAKSAMKSDNYPYLLSVDSVKDIESEEYLKSTTVTYEKLRNQFKLEGRQEPKVIKTDELGYVEQISVDGKIMSGEQFRKILSLPSACFEIRTDSKGIKIISKGKGHGLGLSQYGANEMAKSGKNYKEILNYYYNNISIVNE
jgi:stage II sporulation protein D